MFIPKTLTVGYTKRQDTFTGKLAYVIYTDEKGVLRKEKSWNTWRDKKIDPSQYNNEPTEGFVLNKKVGGYATGWNHRQTYTRIYDPRGFEFEISIQNLLYILEHADCLKGKGLDGSFVYAWYGTDLWLMPYSAPETQKALQESDKLFSPSDKLTVKDLKIGHTYAKKNREEGVYLGKRADTSGKMKHVFISPYSVTSFTLTSGVGSYINYVGDMDMDNLSLYLEAINYAPEFNKLDRNKCEFIDLANNVDLAYEVLNYIYLNGWQKAKEKIYDNDITYYDIANADMRYDDEAGFVPWLTRRPDMFDLLCSMYGYSDRYCSMKGSSHSFLLSQHKKCVDRLDVKDLLSHFKYILPIKDVFENNNVYKVYYSTSKLYGVTNENRHLKQLKEKIKYDR